MNIAAAVTGAAATLTESGVAEPHREARSLLAFAIARDAAFLIAHPEYELTENESRLYESLVDRRAAREPYQYITGRQEFYALDFVVTPDVLIPRPETEILAEAAVDLLSQLESPRFCEIGVGSGCISISILKNVPKASAVGTDISAAALEIAKQNAAMHSVDARLSLIEGDLLHGVEGDFDLIVSNPPYIPERDIADLQPEVRDHEPLTALTGGEDGLNIIRRIILDAPASLKPKGTLMMEIGFEQSAQVRELFDRTMWHEPALLADLAGIPRIVVVERL